MIEAQLRDAYDTLIASFWREKAQLISFQGKDALTIRGMMFLQPRPEIAIVISSGRTESFIKYKELIYDLYLEGYSVFIADHRGQGLSDRVIAGEAKRQIGYVREFQDYISDLKQLYEEFVKPTMHQRHVLFAHSMGGCIASLYLEAYNHDFDVAVLSSPMDELALGFHPRMARALIEIEAQFGLGEDYAPGEHDYDDDEKFSGQCLTHSELRWNLTRGEYSDNPAAKLGGPSVRWVKLAQEAGVIARKNAGDITVPLLLLQAGDDAIVKPEGQVDFCQRLNAVHPGFSRLEPIEGSHHEIFMESDLYRERAFQSLLDFTRDQIA